ncbi:molybdenum cofactor guanylyltransferase [Paenibacillus sp. CAA11]|uniref:molybdenum cofactor guanylyltransferase n=1 Tax=Paenibacillus sp. CAA11 TaxID=1532905 RepID=UPI000D35353F|nr:molybdenum cofactor guanylyltransferase [Paenibacillus sp. CAA11]AWB46300.1 molybdenum cofactor guanylyltransferase [Paenibacillus sp. CAA11]
MDMEGLILAGGLSTRMGEDKAMLPFSGSPLIARLADELRKTVQKVTVAAGEGREAYRFLGLPQVLDAYPGAGPLAGLHAGLSACGTSWCLVSACDMPFVQASWLKKLADKALEAPPEVDAVLTLAGGRVHPLLGAYRKRVASSLREPLEAGKYKVMAWVDTLEVIHLQPEEQEESLAIYNMNHPREYHEAVRIWGQEEI